MGGERGSPLLRGPARKTRALELEHENDFVRLKS